MFSPGYNVWYVTPTTARLGGFAVVGSPAYFGVQEGQTQVFYDLRSGVEAIESIRYPIPTGYNNTSGYIAVQPRGCP